MTASGPAFFGAVVLLMALNGCATTGNGEPPAPEAVTLSAGEGAAATDAPSQANPPADDSDDPLEPFNRAMYKFNDVFDDYVFEPVARGYRFILPAPARKGLSNFFANLTEPINIVNNFLQGKIIAGITDTARLLVNSTLGLGGFIDMASYMEYLDKHDEDFGQTLAVWGVGAGPYIVWPFLGPKNVRDSFGWAGDWILRPTTHAGTPEVKWGVFVVESVDKRSQLLGTKDVLEQAAGEDPYVFVREAYRQRRLYQIHDGNPPVDESLLFDDL